MQDLIDLWDQIVREAAQRPDDQGESAVVTYQITRNQLVEGLPGMGIGRGPVDSDPYAQVWWWSARTLVITCFVGNTLEPAYRLENNAAWAAHKQAVVDLKARQREELAEFRAQLKADKSLDKDAEKARTDEFRADQKHALAEFRAAADAESRNRSEEFYRQTAEARRQIKVAWGMDPDE